MLLRDKRCLVSGVGLGLGADIALAFTREGADVARSDRISDAEQGRRIVDAAVADLGRLDVLVLDTVADDASAPEAPERFETADLAEWRRIMDVNLFGTLQLAHAAIPAMKANGTGAIVFVSSMVIRSVPPLQCSNAASKAALYTAAQVLAKELGPHGIRVNTIVVGAEAEASDCANVAVFFASDLSSVITGQALDVDGGKVFY